jgi:AcrR family transcriptional regulator
MPKRKPTARRQRRIAARRAQILDAASRVFAAKGFHSTSTKEIAEAADVAEGTIYNYFESKADLLIGIMARLAELEHIDEELAVALQEDFRDFFVAILRQRMGRIRESQEMLQAILPEILVNPPLRERFYAQYVRRIAGLFEQYLQERIAMGDVRPVDVPLTVRAVQAMFVGLLLLRILGDQLVRSRWEDLPEVLTTLVVDGLHPDKGGMGE